MAYTLTINLYTASIGGVSLNPAGGSYDPGTVVTVEASPAGGCSFWKFTGDLVGTTNPITITMNDNKTVNAWFQYDKSVNPTVPTPSVDHAVESRARYEITVPTPSVDHAVESRARYEITVPIPSMSHTAESKSRNEITVPVPTHSKSSQLVVPVNVGVVYRHSKSNLATFTPDIVTADSYTKLYLPMDSNFDDTGGKTATLVNTPTIDGTVYKYTGSGKFLSASTQYAYFSDSSDFTPRQSKFTIRFWYRPISHITDVVPIGQAYDANNRWIVYFNFPGNYIGFYYGVGGTVKAYYTCSFHPNNDQWYHFQFCRINDIFAIAIDGVWQTLTATNPIGVNDLTDINARLVVGRQDVSNSNYCNGYIDDLEYAIGIARGCDTAYTDYATAANEDTTNDVALFSASPAVGDHVLFGGIAKGTEWMRLLMDIGTAGAGTWTLTWYYWNGTAWTALSGYVLYKMNGLNDFKTAGLAVLVFAVPTDMALKDIEGRTAYYIRAEITAFTNMTTQPLASRIWFSPDYALGGAHWKRYGGIKFSRNGNTQLGNSIQIR